MSTQLTVSRTTVKNFVLPDSKLTIKNHFIKHNGVTVGKIVEQTYDNDKPFFDAHIKKGNKYTSIKVDDYIVDRRKTFNASIKLLSNTLNK